MKAVFQIINPDNSISVNRRLAHAVGLQEAVVYSALLAKYAWYESQNRLTKDGWFYSTAEDLEDSTALTRFQQNRCIKKLISAGLILCCLKDTPAKRYFYIVDDTAVLEKLLTSGGSGADNSGAPESDGEHQDPKELENKMSGNCNSSFEETSTKTKDNKIKENKPKVLKQDKVCGQIRHAELSAKYGEGFADLVAEVVAEGISSGGTDGQTDEENISSVFHRVDFDTVCHVADYISTRKCNIRNMKAYLRSALYKAVGESAQKPRASSPETIPGITEDDILAELRAQYS